MDARASVELDQRSLRPKRRRPRVVVALVIAAIVVLAALASAMTFGWGPFARPGPVPSGPLGPGVAIQVDPPAIAAIAQEPFATVAGSVVIQISSVVPASTGYLAENLSGINATTNPYTDLLFQGAPGISGIASGNLSAQFYSIDQSWLTQASPLTQTVSLQLHAELNVVRNGTDEVYTYFDNLPYDPHAPPLVFTAKISFPSTPMFAVPATTPAAGAPLSPDGKTPPPCNVGYYWVQWNSTYISNGVLPLAIGNANQSPAGAELSYGISFAQSALQLSFTSDTAYTSYSSLSGLQMSQNPSWSGNDTTFQGAIETSTATSGGNSVTMIGLTGVEMTVTNYRYVHVWGTSGNCNDQWYDKYMESVQVDGFSGGSSFTFGAPALPSFFSGLMNDMSDWGLLASENLKWGGSGFELYSVMVTATGYNSASNAEGQAEAALSTLSFCLGTMLLADDVLGFFPGFGDVGSTAIALEAIAEVAGDAAMFMTMFNSISFSTSEHTSVEQFGVSVGTGGTQTNLVADVYAATQQAELTLGGGNSYYPNMPLVYVVAT